LREHSLFSAVRKALAEGKQHFGFSLVHFSVQRDHLHLIAEASDRRALSRGIQGLSIRVARAVNRQLARKGRLFSDRYHARALKTPREVRFALRYVLLNARKHTRGPQGSAGALEHHRSERSSGPLGSAGTDGIPSGFVDSRSSAPWFRGFSRPDELVFGARQARAEWLRTSGSLEPPVVPPECWLLRAGQQRAGPIDIDAVPSGGSD
jgi:REP element-mobilizing transposase RayT